MINPGLKSIIHRARPRCCFCSLYPTLAGVCVCVWFWSRKQLLTRIVCVCVCVFLLLSPVLHCLLLLHILTAHLLSWLSMFQLVSCPDECLVSVFISLVISCNQTSDLCWVQLGAPQSCSEWMWRVASASIIIKIKLHNEAEGDVIIPQWVCGAVLHLLLHFKWDFAYLLQRSCAWRGTPFRLQINPIWPQW